MGEIDHLKNQKRTPRLLVVGDIAVDWILRVSSLELRIADLSFERADVITERLGGGGLVFAVAAHQAGFETTLVAAVGRDAGGATARQYLAERGVHAILTEVGDASTAKSLIIRDEVHDVKAMVSHRGANVHLSPNSIPDGIVGSADLLYVSGYALLDAPQADAALHAMEVAKAAGVPIVLDVVPHRTFTDTLSDQYRAGLSFASGIILELGTARRLLGDMQMSEADVRESLLKRFTAIILHPDNDSEVVATRSGFGRSETGYRHALQKTGYLDGRHARTLYQLASSGGGILPRISG